MNLDGSQSVCGTLRKSAVTFVNLVTLSWSVRPSVILWGPSVNLNSSKSVCGALCESVWSFMNADELSDSVKPSVNLAGSQSVCGCPQ